jgi:egghead protein (zeste-white 4 protein)
MPFSTVSPGTSWSCFALHAFLQYVCLGAFLLAGLMLSDVFLYQLNPPRKPSAWADLLRACSLLTLPVASMLLLGLLMPPRGVQPSKITEAARRQQVVFRWCTRGCSPNLTVDIVRKAYALLKDSQMNFLLEVVTDRPCRVLDFAPELSAQFYDELVVPTHWRTLHLSLFKARALHFAMLSTKCDPDAVIVHLDEESEISESFHLGVRQFISEHPGCNGQGIISYRNVGSGWQSYLVHIMDSMRVGTCMHGAECKR